MATGLVFVTGLVGVWIALSERAPAAVPGADEPAVRKSRDAGEAGLLYTHRHHTAPGLLLRPQEAAR